MKRRLYRIGLGAFLFVLALAAQKLSLIKDQNGLVIMFLIAYLVAGHDVIRKAGRNIVRGQVMDENFLMVVASLGAFLISEMSEAVGVMLFYEIGEFFQDYAVNHSRRSIAALMDIRPDQANVRRGQEILTVSPEEVNVDEIIVIKPGERIPLDAVVTNGNSYVDTMAVTGEPVPRAVCEGEPLISGCINKNGVLEARVTRAYADSTVARILDLVENAAQRKAQSEAFITRFARYYTPIVVITAVLLALIPSLITGEPSVWIYRALSFLVISCPCALVISVPLSFFGGIGGASSKGILIKGSNYLEALAGADTVVFDKTGTLTKGVFEVSKILPTKAFLSLRREEETILPKKQTGHSDDAQDEDELLCLAAYAESYSTHPIASSIIKTAKERGVFQEGNPNITVSDIRETAGKGVSCVINNMRIVCGNERFLRESGIPMEEELVEDNNDFSQGTAVYLAVDNIKAGVILIADEIKTDAEACIAGLKAEQIRSVMLTGDHQEIADAVAKKLGIDTVYAELLPGDKVDIVEKLIKEEAPERTLVFMGDGINDAPVLARADIGVAMGGVGSDAAIEAADIVLMTDEPAKLLTAARIARKTLRIVRENIIFAIGVKLLILILAAFGIANMWGAVFADVGVAMIAILNAMRAMK
ncbi:MAG: heavy metal translocating P-type ATPase [Lachnospiraceae bacterium]|nr:heavy metal translocating P-type ATPase [Lachnospiraceae bacterium]